MRLFYERMKNDNSLAYLTAKECSSDTLNSSGAYFEQAVAQSFGIRHSKIRASDFDLLCYTSKAGRDSGRPTANLLSDLIVKEKDLIAHRAI